MLLRLIFPASLAIVLGIIAGVLFLPLYEPFVEGNLCLLEERRCTDGMTWGLLLYAPLFSVFSLLFATPIIFFLLDRDK